MTTHTRRDAHLLRMAAVLLLLFGGSQAFFTPARQSLRPVIRRSSRSRGALSAVDANDLFQGYMGLIHTHPLITKCATSAMIVPLGDLSAQAIETYKAKQTGAKGNDEEEDLGIDWKRVLRFLIFGATLQPIWNHYYFQWFDHLIPPPSDPISLTNVLKVALDQGIQAPIFTVVIFAYLDLLEGKNLEETKAQIKRDFWPCITTNWWVWIPITCANYALVPPDLRVLFVNVAFLGWCVFLSLLVNKKDGEPTSQTRPSES